METPKPKAPVQTKLVSRDIPVRNPAFQQNEALRALQKDLHHRKNSPKVRFKK
jgi:hypothetical protein